MQTMTTQQMDPRQQHIMEHYPLVRTIACRMGRRLPPSVDLDELINVGMLGLIEAVDRFEPGRSVPFKAYAEIRVRGAMLDSLRNDDWVPRSVRRKFNRIDYARAELTRELERDPTREEMAGRLELTLEEYEDLVGDARINRLISLDVMVNEDGTTPLIERIGADEDTAEQHMSRAQVKGEVAAAIKNLPENERMVVSLYYVNGLTLREIGEILGVTESRACQIRGQGVKRLKYRLREVV